MIEEQQDLKKPPLKPVRKIQDDIQEDDGGEVWLTSYADLMTLVACFFIMMMAFANFDNPTFNKMAKDVGKYFKGANLQVEEDEFTELVTNLETITHDTDQVKITSSIDGAEMVFKSSYLFNSGSADLIPEVAETMQVVIQSIMRKSKNYFIEVEGHADIKANFIHNPRFKDNWMLSAARAATIIKIFEGSGYPIEKMRAVGYGISRPKHPHYDLQGNIIEDNLAENRRIVVKITNIKDSGSFGLLYDKKD